MNTSRFLLFAILSACLLQAQQAAPYPPVMQGAIQEVYKTVNGTKLNLHIFNPPGFKPAGAAQGKRAAIILFFGGGWTNGTPGQFEQQCRHLATKGMVAIAADYRVKSRNQSTITDSVRDAKSAIRYVRENADRLGIDPSRIAAGGGSAGGHIAAAAGVIIGLDNPSEKLSVSSRPNALVLFNPVVIMAPAVGDAELTAQSGAITARGAQEASAVAISPWHYVTASAPPTIIFHGTADTTVPFVTVEAFTRKMQAAGVRCDLIRFERENHGFFNFRPVGNKNYDETLAKAVQFLTSLGYIK